MSDLSATDRDILRMIFNRERDCIRGAFARQDLTTLACALAELGAAIDGLPSWAELEPSQQPATAEQLQYRQKFRKQMQTIGPESAPGQCTAEQDGRRCSRPVALDKISLCAGPHDFAQAPAYKPRLQVVR